MSAPFGISPSALGRYFFHDCDRFLRLRATRSPEKHGLPSGHHDAGSVMEALLEGGRLWEEQVIEEHLAGRVRLAPGTGPLRDRAWSVRQSLEQLRQAQDGEHIHQLTLHAPETLYGAFALDPGLVAISDNRPDLVRVESLEGRRRFRVIEVKRGAALRMPYRVQVLFYALELRHILLAHGIEGEVELSLGEAWLGGSPKPAPFEMDTMRPHLEELLTRLPRILQAPIEDLDWHLRYRCEWCEYLDYCRSNVVKTDDVSRLVGLTAHGKRFLTRELGVRTLPELREAMRQGDFDKRCQDCASLAGERPRLEARARAYAEGRAQLFGSLHPALPVGEHVAIFLTAQSEPVEGRIWLLGYLVQVREELRQAIFGDSAKVRPAISLAAEREAESTMHARFVERLYELLSLLDTYNRSQPLHEDKLSLQVYCYSEQEREALMGVLMEVLYQPELAPKAMALLFHFQAVDLLRTDDHPSEILPFPIIPLVSATGALLALPVDVSYTLPEVLQALGCKFEYARSHATQFPFGHGLRADRVHQAWNGASVDLSALKREAAARLYAYRALLWTLREQAGSQLSAWPPRHQMHASQGVRDPLLSRLVFLTRYESLLSCLALRASRFESRALLEAQGGLVPLLHEGGGWFRVAAEGIVIEESSFTRWLVVRDSDRGLLAQARFNDWGQRRTFRFGARSADPEVGIGAVDSIVSSDSGFTLRLHLCWDRPHEPPLERGAMTLLMPRFMDMNADKLAVFLRDLDQRGAGLFLELLRDPASTAPRQLPPPDPSACPIDRMGLTPSQLEAWCSILRQRVTAIWGPPGTGKTWFLASVILGMLPSRPGRGYRVMISAMTHAAIENLLAKLAVRARELGVTLGAIAKVGGWRTEMCPPAGLEEVDKKVLDRWLDDHPVAVVGSTGWGLLSSSCPFDLVLLDEASQLEVAEAAVAVDRVSVHGRLVVAGDHEQLGPILVGSYPEPPPGEPALHGSIFDLIRRHPAKAPLKQLLENFRMNEVLTRAARLLYGERFVCGNPEVAGRRLRQTGARSGAPSELTLACLDPEWPLVLAILNGARAGRVNELEARIVAEQVIALRGAYAREDDRRFWRERAFVVSPHHAQIRAIRLALSRARTWEHPPFVDTVDKMQGQEADAVFISYGVADPEYAAMEAEFIYSRNRLNVSITRARCKSVVFLPRPLLEASPEILDDERVACGLAHMRGLVQLARQEGERSCFSLGEGASMEVLRLGR